MRGRILGLCLIFLLCLPGCGGGGEPDEFTDQRTKLERAWHQGREARISLTKYGHSPKEVTPETCAAYFDGTDASNLGRNDRFRNLAGSYFVKGCLGLPATPPTP